MASFISASAFSTLAGMVSLVFGFLSSVIVARLLGAEGTGTVAFGLWVAMTASTVANLGVPAILTRYMPTYDCPGNPGGGLARAVLKRFAVPFALTTLALIGYVAWTMQNGAVSEYSPGVWAMIIFLFIAYGLAAVAEAAARGLNRFDETTRLAFYGCLIQVPLIIVGAYFFGIVGALAGYVVRHVPQAFRLLHYIRKRPEPGTYVQDKMRAHGRNDWFSDVVGLLVWGRIEILFIGLYFSTTEIGYYAAGLTLAGLVVQLPTQMVAALTPHIGRHHDNRDVARINQTYQRVMRWLTILIVPVCFGGAAIMPVLLPLLFGNEFTPAVAMAAVVVASAFTTALSLVPALTIGARERSDFYLYSTPVVAALSICALALAVPHSGGLGAAWVRFAIHGIWLTWLVAFCWLRLDIRLNLLELAKIGLSGLLCAASAFAVLQSVYGMTGLVLAVTAGALAYFAALRLFHCIPKEDVQALADNLPSVLPNRLARFGTSFLMLLVPGRGARQA